MNNQREQEEQGVTSPVVHRRTTMKSLGLGLLALFAGNSAIATAQAQSETAGAPAAVFNRKQIEQLFATDTNLSLTIGDILAQVGAGPSNDRPKKGGKIFCWSNWLLVTPVRRAEVLIDLPPDLKITNDMTLQQALAALDKSGDSNDGIYATSDGMKLVQKGT